MPSCVSEIEIVIIFEGFFFSFLFSRTKFDLLLHLFRKRTYNIWMIIAIKHKIHCSGLGPYALSQLCNRGYKIWFKTIFKWLKLGKPKFQRNLFFSVFRSSVELNLVDWTLNHFHNFFFRLIICRNANQSGCTSHDNHVKSTLISEIRTIFLRKLFFYFSTIFSVFWKKKKKFGRLFWFSSVQVFMYRRVRNSSEKKRILPKHKIWLL